MDKNMSGPAAAAPRETPYPQLAAGLIAAVALAAFARVTAGVLPPPLDVIDEVVLAMLLGMLIANVVDTTRLREGLQFAMNTLLRAGIVLLGFRLSLAELGRLGAPALVAILAIMVIAVTAVTLVSRVMPIGRRQGALVAVGTAICGNSAIAAAAPTIGADEDEVARAIAANTLVGTLALFLYPLIGEWVGAAQSDFGAWAGVAINDTAQAVAAGFAYSDVAGQTATTIKLVRNALMAPALVILALAFRRGRGEALSVETLRRAVPTFVVLFIGAATLTSLGATAAVDELVPFSLESVFLSISRGLIVVALAAIGLSTPARRFRRGGWTVIAAALAAGACTAVCGYVLMVELSIAT